MFCVEEGQLNRPTLEEKEDQGAPDCAKDLDSTPALNPTLGIGTTNEGRDPKKPSRH